MKKNPINIIAALAAFLLAVLSQSCSSTADEGNMGSFPYLEISEPRVEVSKTQQTIKVAIQTNRDVMVVEKHDWITTTVNGQESISIKVTENTEEKKRDGQITVTTKDKLFSETIIVVQDESGVHTYKGNVVINSNSELADFVKNYTRVEGNLILGNEISKNPASMSEVSAEPKASSLTDISSLSAITEVTGYITVAGNPNLKDISVLKNFATVTELRISDNPLVTSIDFIKNMNVTTLMLTHSADFSKYQNTVGNLTKLTYLDISCNGITDISFLSRLTKLETLILGTRSGETNYISDITVLHDISSLRNLNVSGLPLTLQEIEDFKSDNPRCNVTMDTLAASTPLLGTPGTSSKDLTSLTLSCTVLETGTGDITKSGFYFGENPDNLTKILANVKNGYITYTKTGLTSSKQYYFYAWAENSSGTTTTDIVSTYTCGTPQIDTMMTIVPTDNSISVTSKLFFNGGSTTECGTIIGQNPDITIENNLYKKTQNTDQETDFTWTSTFSNLSPGYRYYVRSYAKNEYGTVYNTVKKVYTTGTPDVAISVPVASDKTDMSFNLRSVINNMDYGAIAEAGFYISVTADDIDNAEILTANVNSETGEITASASGLQSSTKYYVRSFVEFEVGVAVRSDVAQVYTYGLPVIDMEQIDYTAHDTEIYLDGYIKYTGGEVLTYGAIISKTDDLDINNYLDIITISSATERENLYWTSAFTDLNSGYRYYIRHYATNSYGTAYSEPIEVYTTGTTWIQSYEVLTQFQHPQYNNTDEEISYDYNMYAMYYREDVAQNTGWVSHHSYYWDDFKKYAYSFMEGEQSLIFTNIQYSSWDSQNIQNNTLMISNPDDKTLLRYTPYNTNENGPGLGNDIIIGLIKDTDIKEGSTLNVQTQRVTTSLTLSLTYSDKYGDLVNDLSSILHYISIDIEGLNNECNISKDLNISYGKPSTITHNGDFPYVSDTYTIFDAIDIFPTSGLKLTVHLTFDDGRQATLVAGTKEIAVNTKNDLVINISELEGDVTGNFTIEVLENVKEEIEF